MFAIFLPPQGQFKQPLLCYGNQKRSTGPKIATTTKQQIIVFKTVDDVLALTGIKVERKGRKSVFVRTERKSYFTDRQSALAFCKKQLLANSNYVNSLLQRTRETLAELTQLRNQMGPNQKFYPNGTPKQWQVKIDRVEPRSNKPPRDKADILIAELRQNILKWEQQKKVLDAGLSFTPIRRLPLEEGDSLVPCGKMVSITYPQTALSST